MKTLPNTVANLTGLQAAIRQVKTRIKTTEADLENRWDCLPKELLKTAAGAILPIFISNKIAKGTWLMGKAIGRFLLGKDGKQTYLQTLLTSAAKKFGISSILKLILGLINK